VSNIDKVWWEIIKYLCSKFHKISSNKNLKKRLRFYKVAESLKVETCIEKLCRNFIFDFVCIHTIRISREVHISRSLD